MASGFKTGGRRKGSRNRKTVLLEEKGREALANALGPHAVDVDAHSLLMAIYKNEAHPIELRLEAAKAAIRFEKPALGSIDQSVKLETKPASEMSDDELAAIAAGGSGAVDARPVSRHSGCKGRQQNQGGANEINRQPRFCCPAF
jgi:hypothetical protein